MEMKEECSRMVCLFKISLSIVSSTDFVAVLLIVVAEGVTRCVLIGVVVVSFCFCGKCIFLIFVNCFNLTKKKTRIVIACLRYCSAGGQTVHSEIDCEDLERMHF